MPASPLKVLFVASECAPFAKTGGLADVAGALPKALRELDIDVRVVMPLYAGMPWNEFEVLDGVLTVPVADRTKALVAVSAALTQARIDPQDLTVRRPTLDEAFLQLTGGPAVSR